MLSRKRIGLGLAAIVMLAACGGQSQPLALVASSPGSVGVGEQRLLLGLVDPESQVFLADPDLEATATLTGPDDETLDVPLDFIWALEGRRGLYRAMVDFPQAGVWAVEISAAGLPSSLPAQLFVSEDIAMPQVGDPAPSIPTRTAADHDLAEITTDPDPDPSFYRLSLDEALGDGRPTVIVFATPAFCTTETCGPALDTVKDSAIGHPGADFIHVEVYENLDASNFDDLKTVGAVDAWALPSEPWVFVTDSDGVVTARFEGTLDAAELEAALTDLGS
ncbi:hypothetical protein BH23ACT5_BH23ACT5_20370 [soil metagenome]